MARRGRKPASSHATALVPPPAVNDPETFNYDDLANIVGNAMNDAKARIGTLTSRIDVAFAERDALHRFVAGAEQSLGLNVPGAGLLTTANSWSVTTPSGGR